MNISKKKRKKPAKLNQGVIEGLQKALNDNIKPEFKEKRKDGKKMFNKNKTKKEQPSNGSA